MRFNVGDKVRFNFPGMEEISYHDWNDDCVGYPEEMRVLSGLVMTIRERNTNYYKVDRTNYSFDDWVLSPIKVKKLKQPKQIEILDFSK